MEGLTRILNAEHERARKREEAEHERVRKREEAERERVRKQEERHRAEMREFIGALVKDSSRREANTFAELRAQQENLTKTIVAVMAESFEKAQTLQQSTNGLIVDVLLGRVKSTLNAKGGSETTFSIVGLSGECLCIRETPSRIHC